MSESAGKAVFLSYASQDAEAARRICEVLRAGGVEVWLDQEGGLVGGDAWDAKIRKQIAECALFVPIISASTQARLEGYFRLEWKLAAQRTQTMADEKTFLLPVVIDATRDAEAKVPVEFKSVQWTRLNGGETSSGFVARVRALLEIEVAPVSDRRIEAPGTNDAGRRPALPRRGFPAWAWGVLAISAVAILAVLVLSRKSEPTAATSARPVVPPSPAAQPPTDLASAKSVAVLAFANMSADKDSTEYFSDGISEEILDRLANDPALRVAARTSSFSFKGKNATAGEIGRALNVARLIEGSVRKAGNKVRITVQLINAADGYHLWSETFERDLTDIFAVQSEIAAKVAQKISGGPPASPAPAAPLVAAPTKNLAAHDAYLRGRAAQVSANPTGAEAVRLYEEAVRLDPGYAVAWARLAQMFARMTRSRYDSSVDIAAKARNAATTALQLNPDLPEGHLAMALVRLSVDHDFDATQRELDETERLHPSDPEVPATRALLELARGHWGEGLVALTARAVALDPLNGSVFLDMGRTLALTGSYAEAARLFSRGAELAPDSAARLNGAENELAWTGEVKRALDVVAAIPENLENIRLRNGSLAMMLAMNGEIAPAIAALEKVMANVASHRTSASGPRGAGITATYRSGQLEAWRGNGARAAELYAEALTAALQFSKDYPGLADGDRSLAIIRALRGERTEALAAMDNGMEKAMRTRDAAEIGRLRQVKAEVLMILGETDAAVAELRVLHEMGWALGYTLRRGLEWERLRGDAKFQQLMKDAEARADAQPRPGR